jgi:hypothetical protein
VVQSLDRFLNSNLAAATTNPASDQRVARAALVALAALEAEISFLLASGQEQIRARSERAFLLLQRILAVDPEIRAKWRNALEAGGEVQCERLGAVHLLSQGIFAFKVNAEGARTDLVFNELPSESLLAKAVDGLVLTEWKVATDANAVRKRDEALAQAEQYRAGILAGAELTAFRYLVLVSLTQLVNIPPDTTTQNGITYRCVNIAVEPDSPSEAARKKKNG